MSYNDVDFSDIKLTSIWQYVTVTRYKNTILWQVDIMIRQVDIMIRQVDIIIWQVIAEIYHHRQVDVITWSFLSDLSSNDVHLSDLCLNLLDSLSTCKILFYLYDMVAYFCHHLSDDMSTCQIFMLIFQLHICLKKHLKTVFMPS